MEKTCAVRLTRYYQASPSEVWSALTDATSIARWLAPVHDVDLSPGGAFDLQLSNGAKLNAGVRTVKIGRVLELNWTMQGEGPSVVRFELAPDGDGTILVLDHRLIAARSGMRAMSLWEGHLARLDALLAEQVTR